MWWVTQVTEFRATDRAHAHHLQQGLGLVGRGGCGAGIGLVQGWRLCGSNQQCGSMCVFFGVFRDCTFRVHGDGHRLHVRPPFRANQVLGRRGECWAQHAALKVCKACAYTLQTISEPLPPPKFG